MILVILKNSNKIQGFGNTSYEYGTGWRIVQDLGQQMYVSKQNAEIVEYTGDFPFETFEPCKYLYQNGQIVADPNYVRPSQVTEYGVPEDVVQGIEKRSAEQALQNLVAELADSRYGE